MEADCIPYKETRYFSKIILDYLAGEKQLQPFYSHLPNLDSFTAVMKQKDLPKESRSVLAEAIKRQYKSSGIDLSKLELVQSNVNALNSKNTFTVCTGHQLNLFSGPLYFIYKIVSTIKLSWELKKKYPESEFVPLYWMATEDHDFAEINHFHFQGQKLSWESDQKGAVGRFKTQGMEGVFAAFGDLLADYSSRGEKLKNLFEKAYLKHDNLTHATRYLVNELFAAYGLIILDGDDADLKRLYIPVLKEELMEEISSQKVGEQSKSLAESYKIQVNPREINLFYLTEGGRHRILKEDKNYFIHETDLQFTQEEILEELENRPENFSPNVLLRPVYQECILPNLAYIGGGGELAYWFQLKSTFEHFNIAFPMLLLRNSALWMNEKQHKYFDTLKLKPEQLFERQGDLLKAWVKSNSDVDLDLPDEHKQMQEVFTALKKKAQELDGSLGPHVEALLKREEKAMKQLSEKLIRSQRKKESTADARISHLKTTLFPNDSLQERKENFSSMYLQYGESFIEDLLQTFEFPSNQFYLMRP